MEMFIGLIIGLFLFILLAVVFYIGYKIGNENGKKNSIPPIIPKSITDNPELSEEQKEKLAKIQEGWQNILNYDVSTAMQRKKI